MKSIQSKTKSPTFPSALLCFGGIFDFDAKVERLEEVNAELEQPDVWNEPEKAQALGKERVSLEQVVDTIKNLEQGLEDVEGLLELAIEAEDEETFNEAVAESDELEQQLAKLESDACLAVNMMHAIVMSIYKQVQVVQKHKTGQKCYFACTSVGQKAKALKQN